MNLSKQTTETDPEEASGMQMVHGIPKLSSEASLSLDKNEVLRAASNLFEKCDAGFDLSTNAGLAVYPSHGVDYVRRFLSPAKREESSVLRSALRVVGNTRRAYRSQTAMVNQDVFRHRRTPEEDRRAALEIIEEALQFDVIVAKIVELEIEKPKLAELFSTIYSLNYINPQAVLGMAVTEVHARYVCMILFIFLTIGVLVVEIDLHCCNAFAICWKTLDGQRNSFAELLFKEINRHFPHSIRITGYIHETTLNGLRVVLPDKSEWKAHFLYDRVRLYTRGYNPPPDVLPNAEILKVLLQTISESSSDGPLGGIGLDSFANAINALGVVCVNLRVLLKEKLGIDKRKATELLTRLLRQNASSCDRDVVKNYYFTSKGATIVGDIVLQTLAKNDSFWDADHDMLPTFRDSMNVHSYVEELISKAVRACLLGFDESFNSCAAVIPTFLGSQTDHPESEHYRFFEDSERVPSIRIAIAGLQVRSQRDDILEKYENMLDQVRAYEDPEDDSYHLGIPDDRFVMIGESVDIKIGDSFIEAKPGQGLRIFEADQKMFVLRYLGVAAGKLFIQDESLQFQIGKHWDSVVVKLLENNNIIAKRLYRKSDEGKYLPRDISTTIEAVFDGVFGASVAIWVISQIAGKRFRVQEPIPSWLNGVGREASKGLRLSRLVGGSILEKVEFLTDGSRLCMFLENANKLIMLTLCDRCDLLRGNVLDSSEIDEAWKRCLVKGIPSLGCICC